jgi:Na+/H+-dicarboxylate symporter
VLVPAALWARVPILRFLKLLKEPIILAFTTTSSDAAMPDAMKRLIAFGVPKRIVSFVMPIGYSFNLDGSTLYLAVASVFVAQAANVHMTIAQQLSMMLLLMLTSKGMAGIPRASQVILAGALSHFGLPLEGVLVIIGVDELMDMARTTVNLVGNCLATAVVARWRGNFRRRVAWEAAGWHKMERGCGSAHPQQLPTAGRVRETGRFHGESTLLRLVLRTQPRSVRRARRAPLVTRNSPLETRFTS